MDQSTLVPSGYGFLSALDGRRASRRRATRVTGLTFSIVLGFGSICGSAFAAQEATIQSLDEQVQSIKSDVLSIAAELSNLEERLIHPSDTQVAVFVALDERAAKGLEIDSVSISIDGESIADHVYSWKEVEALTKGGVQRLHTGNLRTGKHHIEVRVAGRLSNGKDFEETGNFEFRKDVEPKRLGITLAGGDSGGATVAVGDW